MAAINTDIVLFDFMAIASQEPRFGPPHVSLFVAILFESHLQGKYPVCIYARNLMKKAKINGVATYHRVIKELQEFGFIKYEPSYNPLLGSLIYILNREA